MNKNDIKLVLFLLLVILVFFLYKSINDSKEKIANVYYDDKLIKTISLSTNSIYSVLGHNGEVVIEVKENKIRVIEETSERHLCSNQGYADVIVCLPNKIIIKVENYDSELDGVAR